MLLPVTANVHSVFPVRAFLSRPLLVIRFRSLGILIKSLGIPCGQGTNLPLQ